MSSDSSDQNLDKIISETLERREAGESLSDAEVIAAHPEIAEQLQVELNRLQVIARARQAADQAPIEETVITSSVSEPRSVSDRVARSGQQLRHYVLVEQIGSGGFGTVWRALDSKLECDVAIKIPRQEKLSSEEIERFIREARVSAQLRKHPNIVSVHEADWEDETAFIVSDFIEGVSLGDRLDDSPIPSDESVALVMAICDALHHAHAAGIVHRDLKPDNILLDRNDVPHVTDFGLAKRESQEIPNEAGQIMGTAAYMSPEQARGASEQADRRSDVFSLGVVLFEMLTGERPFRGSVARTLRQIIDQDPPRLRAFVLRIPLDLETICLKCLEKDPDFRYQTMEELKADLQRFQKHQPILARPIGTAGKLWRWCKRHPVIPWLSLTLMLVTLGAMVTAGVMLNGNVETMQAELRTETERTQLASTCSHATQEFKKILQDRIEDVLDMSRDGRIREALIKWKETGEKTRSEEIDVLKQSVNSVRENEEDPARITFPSPSKLEGVHQALVQYTGDWKTEDRILSSIIEGGNELDESPKNQTSSNESNDSDAKPYSWFIVDRDGLQIARVPKKTTLAEDFWYRSYFTGYDLDLDKTKEKEIDPKKWEDHPGVHLSDVFLTDTKEAYVIAVSAPVRDEQGVITGVVGIFVELGKLIELPALADDQENVSVVIYDARKACGRSEDNALLIQHDQLRDRLPEILESQENEENEKEEIPFADLHNKDDQSDFVIMKSTYTDPFESDEKLVAVRNRLPIAGGLYVVVQMKEATIEQPGENLRTSMIILGLSVVGFSAAILIPMWIIILRRVIKE